MTEGEDFKNVEVVHLEGEGKAYNGEPKQGGLGFKAHQRGVGALIPQQTLLFRQEAPFTRGVITIVQKLIDYMQSQIRHADVVGIGIYYGKSLPCTGGIDTVALLPFQLPAQFFTQLPVQSIPLNP